METSSVQKMDTNTIVEKTVPVAWGIMAGAMKVGGLHITPSMRAGGAAAKYVNQSKSSYKGNPIVEGIISSVQQGEKDKREREDLKHVEIAEVLRRVEEITPLLDSAGESGVQTKSFLYGLAEAMVNASGSGFMGSGKRVNEDESRFLKDLSTRLRISERS